MGRNIIVTTPKSEMKTAAEEALQFLWGNLKRKE